MREPLSCTTPETRPGPEDRHQLAAQFLIAACVIAERLSRLGRKEVKTAEIRQMHAEETRSEECQLEHPHPIQ